MVKTAILFLISLLLISFPVEGKLQKKQHLVNLNAMTCMYEELDLKVLWMRLGDTLHGNGKVLVRNKIPLKESHYYDTRKEDGQNVHVFRFNAPAEFIINFQSGTSRFQIREAYGNDVIQGECFFLDNPSEFDNIESDEGDEVNPNIMEVDHVSSSD